MIGAAESALLRVCADPDGNHDSALLQLPAREWQRLVTLAEGVRAAPLLARAAPSRLAGGGSDPATDRLAALDREARIVSLQKAAALTRAFLRLNNAGIEAIALKGAAIARSCYPEPHLRPMVDIDLLVPAHGAEQAQQLLLSDPDFAVHPDMVDQVWANPEHLVPIVDTATSTTFEVHWRIGSAAGGDALQAMVVRSAGEGAKLGDAVRVPSPVATMLHLLANAALKDGLVAALMILPDIEFALARCAITPEELSALLEDTGLQRAFALVAAVARRGGARWPDRFGRMLEAPPDAIVDEATRLLMIPREVARRQRVIRRAQQGGGAVARALRPDPLALRAHAREGRGTAAAYAHWFADRARRGAAALVERRRYDLAASDATVAWMQGR